MSFFQKSMIAGIFLAIGATAAAQVLPATEALRLSIDIARYRGSDDENTMVEIAYGIPQRSLTYTPDSAGYSASADLLLRVLKGDSVAHQDRWLIPQSVQDTSRLQTGMNLVGLYRMQLKDGDYILRVVVHDRNAATRIDSLNLRLPIRRYTGGKPNLSDVQLAATIRRGTKGSVFYKNTLDVIPNVGGLYSDEQNCYYYAEAYNLMRGEDSCDYYVRAGVYDAVGKEIISREKPKRHVGESSVIVDQFPVGNMRSGTYTLTLSLLDSARTVLKTSARKFFVYNPKLGVDSTLLAGSASVPMAEFMSMDESELDREFKYCRWISMDAERKQYEALSGIEPKRKFLSDFWRRHQPGARDEYMSLVSYANTNYNSISREGYRSDRGRVIIMYGHPDDVDRHPNETETRPYEIWSYNNIQGGVIFVFVQRNTAGDYELVHSTHRNELHDENWDRAGITR